MRLDHAADVPIPAARSRYFRDSEPVWRKYPSGPRFGNTCWDLRPLINRANLAERQLDLTTVPGPWRLVVRETLMTLAQPEHSAIMAAGLIHRRRGIPPSTMATKFFKLRVIARWADEHGVGTPDCWREHHLIAFKQALLDGSHREDGQGVGPATVTSYVAMIKMLRKLGPVLSCGGLTFEPWQGRNACDIAGYVVPAENVTPPLPWDVWANTIKAAWEFTSRFSTDILAASARARCLGRGTGHGGRAAVWAWLTAGERVPLHTGYGRNSAERGRPNRRLLVRLAGVSENVLKPSHSSYDPALNAHLEELAGDPARSEFGGLHTPAVTVRLADGTECAWISELGLSELEYLTSVLRAACYLLLSALTGMRDSEIQELTRDAATHAEGLPALRSRQVKGEDGPLGRERTWWAPRPVFWVLEVLAALSPHPKYLFARSGREFSTYDPQRDIARLIAFTDADPANRIGRGRGLGLDPVNPGSYPVNQSTMRRSFAVYASRYPAAELGLGIQLGHAALRMTSGYSTDSQQQVARLFDTERRLIARAQVAEIARGAAPTAGAGGKLLNQFRARVITDPDRAERLIDALAGSYHLGTYNDCMFNRAAAACGGDKPMLAESLCVGESCANATYTSRHLPVLQLQIRRIDGFTDSGRGHPQIRASLARQRAAYTKVIDHLTGGDDGFDEEDGER